MMREATIMICRALALVGCGLFGANAQAAALPSIALLSIGFREATLADFAATPEAPARRADKGGYLAVTADLNGDGQDDEARILLNEQMGIAYVVAVIESADKVDTYVLSQMQLKGVRNLAISIAEPLPGAAAASASGVRIFLIESGQGESFYCDGEDFSVRVPAAASAKAPLRGDDR